MHRIRSGEGTAPPSPFERVACQVRAPAELGTAVEMPLNHTTLTVQDSEVALAALEQFRAKPALGFSDGLALEVARKAGHLPLGTFDRKLGKLDGAERL